MSVLRRHTHSSLFRSKMYVNVWECTRMHENAWACIRMYAGVWSRLIFRGWVGHCKRTSIRRVDSGDTCSHAYMSFLRRHTPSSLFRSKMYVDVWDAWECMRMYENVCGCKTTHSSRLRSNMYVNVWDAWWCMRMHENAWECTRMFLLYLKSRRVWI